MAKEIKVRAWRNVFGDLVIEDADFPPALRELVRKGPKHQDFTLTFSIPDPRGDWIEKWYKKAVEDLDVFFRHHKTATICYEKYSNVEPTISDVCKGDIYDRKTGIAVAYAKMCGQPIPKFI